MTATFDIRPGEVPIQNVSATRQLVATQESVDVRGRGYLYGLEAGIVYLFPRRVGKAVALEYHGVELVDAERGALPLTFPPQDARLAHVWLVGDSPAPALSFAQRVEDATKRYDLPDPAVAEAFVMLVDGGFDKADAARVLKEAYDRVLRDQGLYRMNWSQWAADSLALARAKEESRA